MRFFFLLFRYEEWRNGCCCGMLIQCCYISLHLETCSLTLPILLRPCLHRYNGKYKLYNKNVTSKGCSESCSVLPFKYFVCCLSRFCCQLCISPRSSALQRLGTHVWDGVSESHFAGGVRFPPQEPSGKMQKVKCRLALFSKRLNKKAEQKGFSCF